MATAATRRAAAAGMPRGPCNSSRGRPTRAAADTVVIGLISRTCSYENQGQKRAERLELHGTPAFFNSLSETIPNLHIGQSRTETRRRNNDLLALATTTTLSYFDPVQLMAAGRPWPCVL